jgi:hypothetical protein
MLIRISLIVAIIAGLAAAGFNFVKVKEKITILQVNLKDQTDKRITAENDARKTHKELDVTKATLKQTEATLAATTEEKDKAVKEAQAQSQRADKLVLDVQKITKERDDAQGDLAAYRATGYNTTQILAFDKQYKNLQTNMWTVQEENKLLLKTKKKLETELALYKNEEFIVPLPAGLKGKVLVTDPKWNFVVLNVGEDQGILERGELLVNRNGKLVAKVMVRSVQKDRCVANVMQGWQIGEIIEGDLVIPAHPAS